MPAQTLPSPRRRKRVDPAPRPIQASARSLFVNEKKGRKYMLIDKTNPSQGPFFWMELGAEVEVFDQHDPQGLRIRGGKTVRHGEELEYMGMVAMSMPLEKWEHIQQYGPDGVTGQKDADRIEAQIIKKRGGLDPIRGMHGFEFHNETTALEPVSSAPDIELE